MLVVEKIMAAHESGEIDVISAPAKASKEKFGCAMSTVFEARKRLRKKHNRPQQYRYEAVLEAHKQGRVDLEKDPIAEVAFFLDVHHDVVRNAIRKGHFKRKVYNRRASNYHYWYRMRKQLRLTDSWGVIPERVGLTRNEWRKKCVSM